MNSLAVLILTKNEEKNIAAAVDSAKLVTEEIVVIDSGSTDATVRIAREHGARTAFRAWDDDFSAQRNFALQQTQADWVFYLDADERITPELASAVLDVIRSGAACQCRIERRSVAFGIVFRHGVLKPDHVMRLFPRLSVKWERKVHEHPRCPLPVQTLGGFMEHYTYSSWDDWERKLGLYTTLWAQEAYKNGVRTSLGGILGHSMAGFFKMFCLRAGFLDGAIGSYVCCTHFFYVMLKYLKLYELQNQRRPQ